jgi:hypothetical protein
MKRFSRRRQTKKQRLSRRRQTQKKRSFSRRRHMRGGSVDLPVPEGSVIAVNLDPKDAYSVPVLVSKAKYENEVLED